MKLYGIFFYLARKRLYSDIYCYLNYKEPEVNIKKPLLIEMPKYNLKLRYNFETNINRKKLYFINEY